MEHRVGWDATFSALIRLFLDFDLKPTTWVGFASCPPRDRGDAMSILLHCRAASASGKAGARVVGIKEQGSGRMDGPTEIGNEIVANFRDRHSGEIVTSVAIAARLSLYDSISPGGPGFGLGQAEMSIPSMLDRPRQPDWHGLNKKDQDAPAARAACWLAICSIIFCCISLGVGCAMWVATIQV
jgi:hypothetical protein